VRSLVLAMALLAPLPAAAIDLTGTWALQGDDGIRCTVQNDIAPGGKERDTRLSTLLIRHTGTELLIEVNPEGSVLQNRYLGLAYTHPKVATKGYGVATACTVPGKAFGGTMRIAKAKASADDGTGTFTLQYVGNRESVISECSGKYVRTSADPPAMETTCP
jgi:hypothetical protein